MHPTQLHDRARIEAFLLRRPELNFYHLGDLDDFFWPYTQWLALEESGGIQAIALVYSGGDPPVLLAIENNNQREMLALLEASLPLLPARIYAHLSPGLDTALAGRYRMESHGEYRKMALRHPARLVEIDTSIVQPLAPAHLNELRTLYAAAYPGNWFDPRMLETGQYVGVRGADGGLAAVAGIHVYSPVYRVAGLGNITTHPAQRGRGLGAQVTAGLCKRLLQTVDHIGLNVRADNAAALRAYQKCGFEVVGTYYEAMLSQQTADSR
ncbi:MAG: GNAT family N-acetyltransferase [Chloroflexi bacterium]|nr:GNAT family N-acetyltransferase [Chloroflexota bacterium]